MGPLEFILADTARSMRRGRLSMWTVYDHPTDHPDVYVARRWEIGGDLEEPKPTLDAVAGDDLNVLRLCLAEAGLTRLVRDEDDDAKIVESWI